MSVIKNLESRRDRYMRDGTPVRMGGIAANLARVKSLAENHENATVVYHLLEESKYYIEWAGREMDVDTVVPLIDLQRKISGWQLRWDVLWADKTRRRMLAKAADRWSLEILRNSGLLEK